MRDEPTSREVEYILAYLYRSACVLEKDKAEQLKDIDLRDHEGRGFSVKYQRRAAVTGNLSFETILINSRTGEEVPGNFMQCKAYGYFFVVPEAEGSSRHTVYWFRTEDLHGFVLGNQKKWRKVRLTPKVKESNRGRKYDDAESLLVPVEKVAPLAVFVDTFDYRELREDRGYRRFLMANGL